MISRFRDMLRFLLLIAVMTLCFSVSATVFQDHKKASANFSYDTVRCKVYFDNDSSVLKSTESYRIDQYLKKVELAKLSSVLIAAHTDTNASEKYNVKLSSRRASAVKDYLLYRRLKTELFHIASYGESRFLKNESNERNRRVEILFITAREIPKPLKNKVVIAGYARDSASGAGLEASLSIEDKNGNSENFFVKCDKQGFFAFSPEKAGEKSVLTQAEGYISKTWSYNGASISEDTLWVEVLLDKAVIEDKLVFENIYFYPNEDRFMPNSYVALTRLYNSLKGKPEAIIEIQGHVNYPHTYPPATDSAKNFLQDLSFRRAKKVYEYLVAKGIDGNRMSYRGFSNTKMVKPYALYESEMVKNRRVEVLLLRKKSK